MAFIQCTVKIKKIYKQHMVYPATLMEACIIQFLSDSKVYFVESNGM